MKKINEHLKLLELIGLSLLLTSLVLAFRYQFKHFYTLLVIGLFFVLYGLDSKYLFLPTYLRLYKNFVLAGIIGDLVVGLFVTKLWYYNYASPWEYIPLYLIAYPIAGIVMIQTYVFFSKLLTRKTRDKFYLHAKDYRKIINLFGVGTTVLFVLTVLDRSNHLIALGFFALGGTWALFLLAYATHMHHSKNLLDKFHSHPWLLLVVVLLTTYINAFLQELPNTVAHEWVYKNWPLQQIGVSGIPLMVLISWLFLALFPATAYYYILSTNKKLIPKPARIRIRQPRIGPKNRLRSA